MSRAGSGIGAGVTAAAPHGGAAAINGVLLTEAGLWGQPERCLARDLLRGMGYGAAGQHDA